MYLVLLKGLFVLLLIYAALGIYATYDNYIKGVRVPCFREDVQVAIQASASRARVTVP